MPEPFLVINPNGTTIAPGLDDGQIMAGIISGDKMPDFGKKGLHRNLCFCPGASRKQAAAKKRKRIFLINGKNSNDPSLFYYN